MIALPRSWLVTDRAPVAPYKPCIHRHIRPFGEGRHGPDENRDELMSCLWLDDGRRWPHSGMAGKYSRLDMTTATDVEDYETFEQCVWRMLSAITHQCIIDAFGKGVRHSDFGVQRLNAIPIREPKELCVCVDESSP